jgi:DNA modification methylase
MKTFENDLVEMTLTDIPYGVVNRKSNGLRNLDKKDADDETFNLAEFLPEVVRLTRGSIYIFCATEQVSEIRATLIDLGLTTRLCIWKKCLSGITRLYVKSDWGIRHACVNDIVKTANRSKVSGNYFSNNNYKLWDGEKWNPIIEILENKNFDKVFKITLRSGEQIRATENHRFSVAAKFKHAYELKVGDCLDKLKLPDSDFDLGGGLTDEVPWFIGLYLAEGSKSGTDLQLSLNTDELIFVEKIKKLCNDYVGNYYTYIEGNKLSVIVTGDIIKSFISRFIFGNYANTKRLTSKVWEMNDLFLEKLLMGYLEGDGGYEIKNNRYKLGFSRNEYLTNDLRTICARLNYDKLKLVNGVSNCDGKVYKIKRGSIKLDHHNCKRYSEIVNIQEVNKRNKENFWDIVLQNNPHIFYLSSGIISHNSNPSPMNGQFLWLSGMECCVYGKKKKAVFNEHCKNPVWEFPIEKNKLHPTQKPLKLFQYLITVSSNPGDLVFDPCVGSGTTALAAVREKRNYLAFDLSQSYVDLAQKRIMEDSL